MPGEVWGPVRQVGIQGSPNLGLCVGSTPGYREPAASMHSCQQGEIPVVDQYKYLGLTLDHQFSLATIIRDRVTPLREKSILSLAATPMMFWTVLVQCSLLDGSRSFFCRRMQLSAAT